MKKILLLGHRGQVGCELHWRLSLLGDVIIVDKSICDLNDLNLLKIHLEKIKPNFIFNAAAYTQVDRAQEDRVGAFNLNAHLPEFLAQWSYANGAFLFHYSTDYVYDGLKTTPYIESDPTHPLNVYGESKLLGDQLVEKSTPHFIILRTSWVYGVFGKNFLKTILRLANEKKELPVVNDQVGSPTSASLIAQVSALVFQKLLFQDPEQWRTHSGVYHLSCQGETSWLDFAKFILKYKEDRGLVSLLHSQNLIPIRAKDFGAKAERPTNSLLSSNKLQSKFSVTLPDWKHEATRCLRTLFYDN